MHQWHDILLPFQKRAATKVAADRFVDGYGLLQRAGVSVATCIGRFRVSGALELGDFSDSIINSKLGTGAITFARRRRGGEI